LLEGTAIKNNNYYTYLIGQKRLCSNCAKQKFNLFLKAKHLYIPAKAARAKDLQLIALKPLPALILRR